MATIWFTTPEWRRLSFEQQRMLRSLVKKAQDVPDHRKRQTAEALVRRGYAQRTGHFTGYEITDKGRKVVENEDRAQKGAGLVMKKVRKTHKEQYG